MHDLPAGNWLFFMTGQAAYLPGPSFTLFVECQILVNGAAVSDIAVTPGNGANGAYSLALAASGPAQTSSGANASVRCKEDNDSFPDDQRPFVKDVRLTALKVASLTTQ